MLLENKVITLGITSAYYAIEKIIPEMKNLITAGAEILPVMSFNLYNSQKFSNEIEEITGKQVIHTIEDAAPIGYKIQSDIMTIVPCTGNTIGKLANGIIDTPVLVAAKTNLKVGNNLVIGISTDDGLSVQAENIGKLLNTKNKIPCFLIENKIDLVDDDTKKDISELSLFNSNFCELNISPMSILFKSEDLPLLKISFLINLT